MLYTTLMIKHGDVGTPLYAVWAAMIQRCHNANHPCYHHYGGRGISVDPAWRKDYRNFRQWAMTANYNENLQLDREHTNKNYCPDNCRFITQSENNKNTRSSKWWVINGVVYDSLRDAEKDFNKSGTTLMRWCSGYITVDGNFSEPRPNCYFVSKYNDDHTQNERPLGENL